MTKSQYFVGVEPSSSVTDNSANVVTQSTTTAPPNNTPAPNTPAPNTPAPNTQAPTVSDLISFLSQYHISLIFLPGIFLFFITPPRNRGGVIFSLQFVCVCVCLSVCLCVCVSGLFL